MLNSFRNYVILKECPYVSFKDIPKRYGTIK